MALNPTEESHRRLLNQSLKFPFFIDDPPSSLSNWSSRVFSVSTDCELNSLAIQRLFNHLELTELARHHHYRVGWVAWGRPRKSIRQEYGEGTLSVRLLFAERNDLISFDVHCYLSPTGDILASRKLAPKYLYGSGAIRLGVKGQQARDSAYQHRRGGAPGA